MTRLDRVLKLLEDYDRFASKMLCDSSRRELCHFDYIVELRREKQQLTQELIEHGCRRKN